MKEVSEDGSIESLFKLGLILSEMKMIKIMVDIEVERSKED